MPLSWNSARNQTAFDSYSSQDSSYGSTRTAGATALDSYAETLWNNGADSFRAVVNNGSTSNSALGANNSTNLFSASYSFAGHYTYGFSMSSTSESWSANSWHKTVNSAGLSTVSTTSTSASSTDSATVQNVASWQTTTTQTFLGNYDTTALTTATSVSIGLTGLSGALAPVTTTFSYNVTNSIPWKTSTSYNGTQTVLTGTSANASAPWELGTIISAVGNDWLWSVTAPAGAWNGNASFLERVMHFDERWS